MIIYLNIKGRVFETDEPVKIEEKWRWSHCCGPDNYVAYFDKAQNAEEKRNGYYCRVLHREEGQILNNAIWLKEPDLKRAKEIFYKDLVKRFNKINKKFNEIIDEKERMEEAD